jgi:hypothetical protein
MEGILMSKRRNKLKRKSFYKHIELGDDQYNYDYSLKGDFNIDFKHFTLKKLFTVLLFINGIGLLAFVIITLFNSSGYIDIVEDVLFIFIFGGIGVIELMASYNSIKKWRKKKG